MLHCVDDLQLKIWTQEYVFQVKWKHPHANRDSICKMKIFGFFLHACLCVGTSWVSVQPEFSFFLSLYKTLMHEHLRYYTHLVQNMNKGLQEVTLHMA